MQRELSVGDRHPQQDAAERVRDEVQGCVTRECDNQLCDVRGQRGDVAVARWVSEIGDTVTAGFESRCNHAHGPRRAAQAVKQNDGRQTATTHTGT